MTTQRTRVLLIAAFVGAGFALPVSASSVPGHPALASLPSCTEVSLEVRCRVDVPNSDFAGPAGDNAYHGQFSWTGLRRTHPIRAHLAPWTYASEVGAPHLKEPAMSSTLLLRSPGDRVFQWLKLTPNRPRDTVFTVHAHMASAGGPATAAIHLSVPEFDDGIEATSKAQTAITGRPRRDLVTSLTVPAGSTATRLGVAIASLEGSAGILVDDVFIVRSLVGEPVPELTPSRN